ncbi:MAG: hypothetical protein MZV70_56230 [Desulfobacterales bacterium]|nr:hypothetical protein [Desulfobacterales bacterium]
MHAAAGMIPHLAEFAAKMAKAGLKPLVIDTFAHYYRRLVGGETGLIHDVGHPADRSRMKFPRPPSWARTRRPAGAR